MVSLRGQTELETRLGGSFLGICFKFSDEHDRPFHIGVPPPGLNLDQSIYFTASSIDIVERISYY